MTSFTHRLLAFVISAALVPHALHAQAQLQPPPGNPVMRRTSLPPVESRGDTARVPCRTVNGILVASVEVNGAGPFWFAIDTGAMGHARINESVAAKLGLVVAGKARSGDPSGKNVREVNLYQLDSLRLGGVTFRNAMASGSPDTLRKLAGVDGILGVGLFADFLLALDYPRAELQLSRTALPDTNGRDIVPFTREHGPIEVALRVGDRVLPTDVDTGNMIAPFVFPTAFVDSLPRKGAPRSGGMAHTVSNEVEIQIVTLAVPVRLGAAEFASPEVAYPALHDRGNIGSRAFADCRVEIDQKNRRLRLTRAKHSGP